MIRFNNDYNHGAHASILEALEEINETSYAGYGEDEWCQRGADEIRKYLGNVDGARLGYWLSCDECDVTLEDLTNKLAEKLSKEFTYEFDHVVDDEHICVRFCTNWSTSEDDVDKLLEFLS